MQDMLLQSGSRPAGGHMFRQSAPPNQGLPFWQTGYGSWELCSLRCRKLPSIDGTSITG